MLIRLLKWFRGYLLVQIRGYSPERFINLCSSKNILIWNLRKIETGYEFNITVQGYRKLKPIVKKTKTMPYIIQRIGLPFYIFHYRKRKIFFIGGLLCCILIYTMSLFIWDISIEGQYSHTAEAMVKYLKSIEVYPGVQKNKVSCSDVERLIRGEYNDIGWVSAEMRGTRLIIKITETNMPEKIEAMTEPSHIIATKDGIVTSIITRKGTPLVQKGSVVKKGDILVSGVLDIILDGNEIINKEAVVADADIILKSYYEYQDEFPMAYVKKEYTEKKKNGYAISVLSKKIFLYNPLKKYDKYDIIESEKNLKFGENFYLPVKFYTVNYREYVENKTKYTKEEAVSLAKEHLKVYIEKLNEKDVLILENNVKISIDEKNCKSGGKLISQEAAVEYKKIDDSEWRDFVVDEHSGEDN